MVLNKNDNTKGRAPKVVFTLIMTAVIMMMLICLSPEASAATTTANVPDAPWDAHIKWQKKFGEGYANAVTPPLLTGDSIYIGSGGKMYRLDRKTGKILDEVKVDGVFGYTTVAPVCDSDDQKSGKRKEQGNDPSGSRLFVPVSEGRVAAVDISGRMKHLWTSESFGDQAIAPLVLRDGKIYTGTYGKNNSFVSIDQETGTVRKLASNESNGYYWTGAYVNDSFVVFGEEADNSGNSRVRSVSLTKEGSAVGSAAKEGSAVGSAAKEGSAVDLAAGENSAGRSGAKSNDVGESVPSEICSRTVRGSVRSSMVKDGDDLYFVSKGKALYKMGISDDTGELKQPVEAKLTGESTGVPLIYKGRAYVGTSAKKVDVVDTATMKRIYSVKVPGYIQGEMLLSEQGGKTRIIGAYNSPVGGLWYIEPGKKKAAVSGHLLIPDHEQFCISPVICDEEGIVYYKNDSGYIMAVAKGYVQKSPKVKAKYKKIKMKLRKNKAKKKNKKRAKARKVILTIKKAKHADGYVVFRSMKKNKKFKKIKNVRGSGNIKVTDKKVKRGKRYYYKVKAFKTVKGKKVYSTFSNTVKVKTR